LVIGGSESQRGDCFERGAPRLQTGAGQRIQSQARYSIAAGFIAWEGCLLKERHPHTGCRQALGCYRARRAGAYHRDFSSLHHRSPVLVVGPALPGY